MLFERLLELLAALAVALGGIAGLGAAVDHADPPANDAALSAGPAQVDEVAAIRAATALGRAAAALAELEGAGPTDGLARAVDALTQAMDNAPDQADDGLNTAMDAVTESPANDAPAGRPGEIPAGPPADLRSWQP